MGCGDCKAIAVPGNYARVGGSSRPSSSGTGAGVAIGILGVGFLAYLLTKK